ncbi:MAG: hypothetical protein N3A02_02135 [Rectinema sp.]|nr:hypothetical protein [Rectinema sp.]
MEGGTEVGAVGEALEALGAGEEGAGTEDGFGSGAGTEDFVADGIGWLTLGSLVGSEEAAPADGLEGPVPGAGTTTTEGEFFAFVVSGTEDVPAGL